jgi:Mg2+/Co2+ transporter CorB
MKEDYLNEKDKERKIKSRQLERKPKNQASKKNTLLNNTKSFLSVLLICPQLLSQDL